MRAGIILTEAWVRKRELVYPPDHATGILYRSESVITMQQGTQTVPVETRASALLKQECSIPSKVLLIRLQYSSWTDNLFYPYQSDGENVLKSAKAGKMVTDPP